MFEKDLMNYIYKRTKGVLTEINLLEAVEFAQT